MVKLGAVLLSAGSEVMSDNEHIKPATDEVLHKKPAGLLMAMWGEGVLNLL